MDEMFIGSREEVFRKFFNYHLNQTEWNTILTEVALTGASVIRCLVDPETQEVVFKREMDMIRETLR